MGGTPPSSFNEAQRVGCPGAGSSSGTTASGDSIGTVIGAEIGKQLSKALFGDPEQEARRKAAAAAAAARADEQREIAAQDVEAQRRARDADAAARAEALLGAMLGTEGPTPTAAPTPPTAAGGGGELQLIMGDEPIARTGASPVIAAGTGASPPTDPTLSGYSRGYADASGCFSQNSGPSCSALPAEQFDACISGYRSGYEVGTRVRKFNLNEAYAQGKKQKDSNRPNDSVSQPGGSCHIERVKAYNSGYAGWPKDW